MVYTRWEDLTSSIKKNTDLEYTSLGCHPDHKGLSIHGKLPFSISEYEFNFFKEVIPKHNLRYGFELATGTAISTLAIGESFRDTDGFLLSVDSYVEEKEQRQLIGEYNSEAITNRALENNQKVIDSFGLTKYVSLKQGWSPIDTESYIKEHFPEMKLDFVFLDCPKSADDFRRDLGYLPKYMNTNKFCICVHDTHCFPDEFEGIARSYFTDPDVKVISKHDFEFNSVYYTQKFPLGIISNIKGI